MFLAETNRLRRLLHLSFIGQTNTSELESGVVEVQALLNDLAPGFVLLTDLSRLEEMDVACGTHIGRIMDLCRQRGVGRIIRVVPKPGRDIGLNILSIFHYGPSLHAVVCENMLQAEAYFPP